MEDEITACSECDGTGSNKANWQEIDDSGDLQYEPIQCQSCGGTGQEPS